VHWLFSVVRAGFRVLAARVAHRARRRAEHGRVFGAELMHVAHCRAGGAVSWSRSRVPTLAHQLRGRLDFEDELPPLAQEEIAER